MADKRSAKQPYQHEPLSPPSGWYGEERRYAIKLEQLLDELYQKYGALERRVKELEGAENASF